MTKRLYKAPAAVNDKEPEAIDAAHMSAVRQGLEQERRREFAAAEEIDAVLRRFDRRRST